MAGERLAQIGSVNGKSGEGYYAATRLMSYSSSREAAFRLKAGGILSQRLPGVVWPCVGWSRSWLELSVLMRHSSSRKRA